MATEQASSRLPTQDADEFRSDVNRLLKQQQQQHNNHCNLNPAQSQSPHTTQTRQHKGGSHSRQGGGHGHHGPTRLQQQSTGTSTRHQHLQSSQQGAYPPTQKQTHHPTQKYQTIRRPQHPKIQTIIPNKCSPTQVLWPTQNSQNRYPPQTHSLQ